MTRRSLFFITLFCLVLSLCVAATNGRRVPTIDDLLMLKTVGGAQISPDGKWVAYTVGWSDFKQDAFVTQIWIAEASTGRKFQLTRGDKSSTSPKWSPSGEWLGFSNPKLQSAVFRGRKTETQSRIWRPSPCRRYLKIAKNIWAITKSCGRNITSCMSGR